MFIVIDKKIMFLEVSGEGWFMVFIEKVLKFVNVLVCIDLNECVNVCDMLV